MPTDVKLSLCTVGDKKRDTFIFSITQTNIDRFWIYHPTKVTITYHSHTCTRRNQPREDSGCSLHTNNPHLLSTTKFFFAINLTIRIALITVNLTFNL